MHCKPKSAAGPEAHYFVQGQKSHGWREAQATWKDSYMEMWCSVASGVLQLLLPLLPPSFLLSLALMQECVALSLVALHAEALALRRLVKGRTSSARTRRRCSKLGFTCISARPTWAQAPDVVSRGFGVRSSSCSGGRDFDIPVRMMVCASSARRRHAVLFLSSHFLRTRQRHVSSLALYLCHCRFQPPS